MLLGHVSVDSLWLAALLGLVQGLTEMLPISSSAHLIVVSSVLQGAPLPMALNVGLHVGTLLALILYFWRDWWHMLMACLVRLRGGAPSHASTVLVPGLVVGSLPAAAIGLLAKSWIEEHLHHPLVTAIPLAVVGWLLWWVDKHTPQSRSLQRLTLKDALLVGLGQTMAFLPGVSRSGATIISARLLHLDRMSAARFSFLLGTPAIAGAAFLHYKELLASVSEPAFLVGLAVSAGVGLGAIALLLRLLVRFGFLAFAIYRSLLAVGILALA